jgi:PAS domain-containing protein
MKPALHASVVWGGGADSSGSRGAGPSRAAENRAADNRKEQRYVVDQPVQVFAPGAPERTCAAQIRDISAQGMQLMVDKPISFGPEIKIRWNNRDINGLIRYSHKFDALRYRIGVELHSSSEPLLVEILAHQSAELQQAKLLLNRQQALLSRHLALLDLASEAVIVTSMEGAILLWNKGAEQLYGWSREEALGRQVNHLFESRVPAEIAAAGPAPRYHLRKNGDVVNVTSRALVEADAAGQPQAILLVNRET